MVLEEMGSAESATTRKPIKSMMAINGKHRSLMLSPKYVCSPWNSSDTDLDAAVSLPYRKYPEKDSSWSCANLKMMLSTMYFCPPATPPKSAEGMIFLRLRLPDTGGTGKGR